MATGSIPTSASGSKASCWPSARSRSRGSYHFLQSLFDKRVSALAAIYFAGVTGSYGVVFFLPQIIKGLGLSNLHDRFRYRDPVRVRGDGPVAWGYSFGQTQRAPLALDRIECGCRYRIAAGGCIQPFVLGVAAMSLAVIGIYGSRPSFWPMPSLFLTGAAAASGMAFINSIGNVGGYIGPMVVGYIKDKTGSFEMALYFLGTCLLLSVVIAYFARRATDPVAALARNEARQLNGK